MPLTVGLRVGLSTALTAGLNPSSGAVSLRGTITAWTNHDTSSSTVNGTSFATPSVTLTAGRVAYAFFASCVSAGNPVVPTLTGAGLTWVQVATQFVGVRRITAFRALGTPSAGALTFDTGVDTQLSAVWAIVQPTGADATGTNGSGATVQSVTTSTASGTTLTSTLAALEHASNHHLAATVLSIQGVVVNDVDFTSLSTDNEISNAITLELEYAANQTACTTTFLAASAAMVSIEVKSGVV